MTRELCFIQSGSLPTNIVAFDYILYIHWQAIALCCLLLFFLTKHLYLQARERERERERKREKERERERKRENRPCFACSFIFSLSLSHIYVSFVFVFFISFLIPNTFTIPPVLSTTSSICSLIVNTKHNNNIPPHNISTTRCFTLNNAFNSYALSSSTYDDSTVTNVSE
jgi:Na+/melibiose symporter-like transporter